MTKFILKLLKITKINVFSAVQLTVISFLIMSFIGGGILFFTERNNEFIYKKPELREVTVRPNTSLEDPLNEDIELFESVETHTFIKEEKREGINLVDAWFTSVSALCVTGLVTIDFSQFSIAGQVTVMILIQMGGLGIILFTSVIAMAVFRGLSEQNSLKSFLSSIMDTDHNDVVEMIKYVIGYTIFFEGTAVLIMGSYLQWFADPSLLNGQNPWWWALFHSVSAFNNAGFSLMNNNVMNFVKDPVINLVIGGLIILGGLGYPVLIAFYAWFRKTITHRSNNSIQQNVAGVASLVQIRVAVIGTIIFIGLGMIVPLITELNNPILGDYNILQKIMIHWFQSVSTRTAGFNSIDIGSLHIATIFLYCALMFVGANPAGTAGGIKIPTVAVLYGYLKDWFMKPGRPVEIMGRNISKFAVSHAIRLFFFSIIFITIIIFGITVFEAEYLITPDPIFNFQKVMFEVFSAFGTVGLSMGYKDGVTSFAGIMSDPSKILLIVTMLFGRVGPLTILQALPWKHPDAHQSMSPDFDNSDRVQIG